MTVQAPAVCRATADLRAALSAARSEGRSVALVPTMGALHDGHLALIARARGEADLVVLSIFVNPRQFNDSADLDRYPRDLQRDAELATSAGADLVYAPSVDEVYPPGFCTEVSVGGSLTETLEGAHRGAGHFHGVTTVVTKLLIAAAPDVALFGAKDAQQLRVIRRLVSDLGLPVRIVSVPTIREADGLAMSSRNAQLDTEARQQAVVLSAAIQAAHDVHAAGARDAQQILSPARELLAQQGIRPEYLELCDSESLTPLASVSGPALIVIAAVIGGVRLIDNIDLP